MAEQTYATHRQLVPMYHVVTFFLLVAILIGSGINLWRTIGSGASPYSASLILALTVAVFFVYFYARIFALKAQDRAIRAEEQLRHYVLTGTLLDSRLTVKQIVGLRFAADGEFVALAKQAANDNMEPEAIKKAVKTWRADRYRA